ncbi:MAG: Calx-beta domain-containing protein [Gloeotrichia echinulata CP02]
MATRTWKAAIDGFWDIANNWTENQLPLSGDDVVINFINNNITTTYRNSNTILNLFSSEEAFVISGGLLTVNNIQVNNIVTLSGGTLGFNGTTASEVNNFTLSGGTLTGTGDLTIETGGTFNWTGGYQTGAGKTIIQGTATLSGNNKFLGSRTIENQGTTTWTGGDIYLYDSAVWNNTDTGVFDIQSDRYFYHWQGNQPKLNNAGTLKKTNSTGTTYISTQFNNTGTVQVSSGTLNLQSGGTSSGIFKADTGGTLLFSGGNYNFTGGSLTGSGVISISGGTVSVNEATASEVNNFTLSGGTLTGTGDLTIETGGTFNWTGGYQTGAGKTIIQGTATLSGNNKFLGSRTIENQGTTTWTGGDIYLYDSAVWNNTDTGVFDIQSDRYFYHWYGNQPKLNNAGILKKTNSTGTTYISTQFNNTGTVQVSSGTLNLQGGGTSSGIFKADTGGTLLFSGGNYNFTGGSLTGQGTISVTGGNISVNEAIVSEVNNLTLSGGTLGLNGTTASEVNNFTLSGGNLTGTGDLTIETGGTFNWTGGYQTGAGKTIIQGTATLSGSTKYLGSRTIENQGTTTWTGGDIYLYNSAVWNNTDTGVFDIQSDRYFYHWYGNQPKLNNAGTLKKTAGTGTTYISTQFNNTGTVQVSSGTLNLQGGGTSSGIFKADTGGTLLFSGGNYNFTGGSLTGSGVISISGGTVSVNEATASEVNNFTLSGGTLTGTGDLTIETGGTFNWTGGYQTGAGKTIIQGTATLSGNNKFLGSRTIENQGTTTWTDGHIYLYDGAVWNNTDTGVFDIQSDRSFVYYYGNQSKLNNAGILKKTAGTGTTYISTQFNNTGTVQVSSGTLNLQSGGTSSGIFKADTGGTLLFSGGNYNFTGGSLTGQGTISVTGGNISVNEAIVSEVNNLTLSGGTLGFNGTTASEVNNFTLSGGTLTGTGDLTIETGGTFNWTGGYQTGAGKTIIQGTATLSGNNKFLGSRTIENQGTTTWTDGHIYLYDGAVWNNTDTGVFDIQSDRSFVYYYGNQPKLNNAGTLKKTAGTGTTYISTQFNNTGTVQVSSGTLNLQGGGTSSGIFKADTGGTLLFSGGNYNFTGGSLTGSGVISISGGTVSVNEATASEVNNFTLSGGTLTGTGDLTIETGGTFNWTGGYQTGAGKTIIQGTATLSGNNKFLGSRTIENQGTTTWTDGHIYLYDGAVWNNTDTGVFDIQSDRSFVYYYGNQSKLNNAGILKKTAGTGTTYISTQFNNTGTVQVSSGTLNLQSGGTSSGNWAVNNGAILQFSSNYTLQGGTLAGSGTIIGNVSNLTQINPGDGIGTLKITGNYTQSTSSNLNIELGGATNYDRLNITGNASLNGNLNISLVNGFTPILGDRYTILDFGGNFSGGFTNITGFNLGNGLLLQSLVVNKSLVLDVVQDVNYKPGIFSFNANNFSVNENGTPVSAVTINRTGGTDGIASVTLNPTDGTANAPADYNNAPIVVNFANGEASKTVTIPIVNDTIYEGDETLNLTLSNPTGGATLGTQKTSALTIVDNDLPTISIAVAPTSVVEDGTNNLIYTFNRSGNTSNPLTVNFNVGGSASFNSDYTQNGAASFNGTSGTITFLAGSDTATLTIDPTADNTFESDETVSLTLGSSSNYTIGTFGAITATITNDDINPAILSFSASQFSVKEDGTPISTVTINRAGNSVGSVGATLQLSNGTATAPTDYSNTPITINFADGETSKTLNIPIVNDTQFEPDETINLTLTNPTGGATLGTQNTAVLQIMDNDASKYAIKFNGINQQADLGTWFNYQNFTLEMWVKAGETQVRYADIIDNNHRSNRSWVVQQNDYATNNYYFAVSSSTGVGTGVSFALTPNTWQHLAFVKDVNSVSVYIDGVLVNSASYSGSINYDGSQFLRLANWGVGGRNWNGSMDEVRIWNTARTASEIVNNFNQSVAPNSTGLVAYYQFNERTGSISADATINGRTASLINNPVWVAENPVGILYFSQANFSVNEDGTPVTTVTVNRTGISTGSVSATVNLTNGTATAPSDYNNALITVNFANGETSKTVNIPIVDDTLIDGNETVSLSLANPSNGATLGTQNTATLMIVDNDLPNTGNWTKVTNGGFETGDLSGWSLLSTYGRNNSWTITNERSVSGNFSAKANTNTGFNGAGYALKRAVTGLTAGARYVLSGFIYTGDLTSGSTYLDLDDIANDPQPGVDADSRALNGINQWQFVWKEFVAPSNQVTVRLVRDGEVKAGESVYIDEVAITPISQFVSPVSSGILAFSQAGYSVNEDGTPIAAVTVTRTGGSFGTVSATINLTNGTSTAESDYNNAPITVNFADGETSKTVTIPIIDDSQFEPDETINLTLNNPTNGAQLGTQNTATLTIINNDAPVVVRPISYDMLNGNTGSYNYWDESYTGTGNKFQNLASLSGGLGDLTDGIIPTENWQVLEAPQGAGPYVGWTINPSITFNFAKIVNIDTVTVYVDDSNGYGGVSVPQSINLSMGGASYNSGTLIDPPTSNPTFYTFSGLGFQGSALTLTLNRRNSWVFLSEVSFLGFEENASAGILAFSQPTFSVNENGTPIQQITINRTGQSNGNVSATLNLTNGTATAPSDYNNTPITVNFANGETSKTVTIPIVNDTKFEPNETINLTLTNPLGGATLGTQTTAQLTIINDDAPQPGTVSFNTANYTVNENGTANINLIRSGGSDGEISVTVTPTDGTATAVSDYNNSPITVTFAEGETSKTVTIPLTDDSIYEPNETVNLTLNNPTGGANLGTQSTAILNIIDNDAVPGVIQFSNATYSINENGTPVTAVTLTRNNGSDGNVSARINLSNGTATAPSDYNNTPITVNFANGETSKTVTIPIVNDTQFEPNETINLTLTNPQGGATLGTQTTAQLTIINDDAPQPGTVSFNTANYTVNENGTANINLIRSGGSDGEISVTVTPVDGTATAVSDYNNSPITVTFANGETSKTVTIPLTDDTIYEPTETVNLTLTNPTGGATLGTQNTAILNIIDNDAVPGVIEFSAAEYTVNEDGTPVTAVTLTRTNGSDGAVSVRVNLSNGTATAPSDYLSNPITVNFTNGETSKIVNIPIVDDTIFDPNQTFNITLSNPTNGATIGSQNNATVTIIDNDSPSLSVVFNVENVNETETATGTITRNTEDTSTELIVTLESSDTTEATVPQTVTIPVNQSSVTFTVTAVGDEIFDANQAITITASATGFNSGTDNITINNIDLADLVVSNIVAPIEAFSGQSIELVWTLTNQGNAEASGTWTDNLFLSQDAVVGNDQLLGSFSFTGSIAPGASIERRQLVTLPLTISGDRTLILQTDANNQLKERPGTEGNNTTIDDRSIQIRLAPIPNLQVSSVTAPPTAFSSQETVVQWTVTNNGTGATSAPFWYDNVWLSLDNTLDNTDTYLGQASNVSYLNVGESYTNSLTAKLPRGIDSNYYFLVKTDANNNVFEFDNENDNFGVGGPTDVDLTPPPDFQVTAVNAPAQGFSGQPLNLTWTVTNQGTGKNLETSWYDEVFMSADDVLDGVDRSLGKFYRSGTLNAGTGYNVSQTVTLPIGVSGDFFFFVRTDAGNQVYENVFESNNTGYDTTATKINLTPPPDLEVEFVDAPATASASRPLTINYRVTNFGATATPNSSWTDTFYLSTDTQLDPNTDLKLGERSRFGTLDIGASYDNSATFTLPNGFSGTYYAFVVTDSTNTVFELNNDNNVVFDTTAINIASLPGDLVVTDVTTPSTVEAGKALTVNWTVTNQGTGDTVVSSWVDRVYVSTDAVIGNGDDVLLSTFTRNGLLNVGGSYSRSELVGIPFNLVGNYQLFVVTDSNNNVYEVAGETNNSSTPKQIAITRQTPDLQVVEVSGNSQTGLAAEPVTVNWTVKNFGSGQTNVSFWYDAIYLSSDQNLGDSNDIYLGRVRRSNSLAVGDEYEASATFTAPLNAVGNFYTIVRTDSDNQVLEDPLENNNNGVSVGTISIAANTNPNPNPNPTPNQPPTNLPPEFSPDLVVTGVNAPETGISGQSFAVSWTVQNNRYSTGNRSWYDAVYLSRDQVFDRSTDIYLGIKYQSNLATGESYTATQSFTIPRGLSGPFYVFAVTDGGNNINESDRELNNIGYDGNSTEISLSQPADLVVGTITIPANGVPGQNATISYTVNNQGQNPALGSWSDSIYISADNQWDVNDALFGKLQHFGDVASGGSYSQTLTAPLPGLLPGNYYAIVRSDIRNQISESNESNNITASLNQFAADAERLDLGTADTGSLGQGQAAYYKVDVAAGETLRVKFDSASTTAANELYIRYGDVPSRAQFDFGFTQALSPDQEVVIPTTKAGTYYVLAYGQTVPEFQPSFTVEAKLLDFEIRSLSTNTGGNAGKVTVEISGAKFDTGTTFTLTDESLGVEITASRLDLIDSTKVFATFDLKGSKAGLYDLVAKNSKNQTAKLQDSFTVVEGGKANLVTDIVAPSAVRPGVVVPITIQFANNGNIDLDSPLVLLASETKAPISLTRQELRNQTNLEFVLQAENSPFGVLAPGATGSITFYAKALDSLGSLDFSLNVLDNPTTSLNWNSYIKTIESQSPELFSDPTFTTNFWNIFRTSVGQTVGELQANLAETQQLLLSSQQNESQSLGTTLSKEDYPTVSLEDFYNIALLNASYLADEPIANQGISSLIATFSDNEATPVSFVGGNAVRQSKQRGDLDPINIYFNVWRNNSRDETGYIDLSKKTYVITHGYRSTGGNPDNQFQPTDWSRAMANAIQTKDAGANVIIVDWQEGAKIRWFDSIYEKASQYVQVVGDEIAEYLINTGYNPSNVTLIGHSLGAQASGDAGEWYLLKTRQKLGEIIALDAAGPLFERRGRQFIVDSSDANNVIGIHTSDWLGYDDPFGHKDLYINPLRNRDLFADVSYRHPGIITFVGDHSYAYEILTRLLNKGEEGITDPNSKKNLNLTLPQAGNVLGSINNPNQYDDGPGIDKIWDFHETEFEVQLDANTIQENSPNGSLIGKLSAKGFRLQDNFTFELVDNADGRFRINNRNELVVADGSKLDYESKTNHNIDVKTSYLIGGRIYDILSVFKIQLIDVDETKLPEEPKIKIPIVAPIDPNDILGPAGFGEEKWLTASSTLPYTIRFENLASATAPAQQVVITQQLDPDLDFRTYRVGDFGWGDLFFDVPDNRAFYNQRLDLTATKGYYVDVSAGIDVTTGEAFWTITTIDPNTGEIPEDALAGFLPPNNEDGVGDGFVNYSIRAKRNVQTGAVIDAEARIVFDTEEPIDTPPIFNTIDAGTPNSTVNVLPATSQPGEFLVTWSGSDDSNGSALANYTIYVSDNGADFTPWLENTTLTEANYIGEAGHTYAFYSVARDNAGNTEAAPSTADAQTTIPGSTILGFGAATYSINEDGTPVTAVTINRDGSNGTLSATLTLANGTATAPADYDNTPITVNFADGETSKTVTIPIVNDAVAEGNETFTLNLGTSSDYQLGDISTTTVTITDNDTAGVTITQSGGTTNVTEGGATDTYTVALTSQPTADVNIALSNTQTATNVNTLTFTAANWNIAQTVTVTAIDDAAIEGNHSGIITHTATSSDTNYNAINIGAVNVNITDNDFNVITGNISNPRDPLTGTAANDRIVGGAGAKTITGGMGNDEFVYTNLRDVGQRIADFTVGEDKIVITQLLSSIGYQGTNPINDGYVQFIQGSTANSTVLQIDRDGPTGSAIFRNFLQLDNVTPTQINNTNNFVF